MCAGQFILVKTAEARAAFPQILVGICCCRMQTVRELYANYMWTICEMHGVAVALLSVSTGLFGKQLIREVGQSLNQPARPSAKCSTLRHDRNISNPPNIPSLNGILSGAGFLS